MKAKNGISLIVLVITIIVIIILAGAVILSLNQNNPVDQAKWATFVNNRADIQEMINMDILDKFGKDEGNFTVEQYKLTGDVGEVGVADTRVKTAIGDFESANNVTASITKGQLNVTTKDATPGYIKTKANTATETNLPWLTKGHSND